MAVSLRIPKSASYADQLTVLTEQMRIAKEALDAADQAHRDVQSAIMSLMEANGAKTGTAKLADANYRVTMVAGDRLDIDEPGLRKALTASVFDKLCNMRLDRTKLELSIAEGRIDPVVVAAHTVHKPSKPFVRVSIIPGSEK